MFTVRYVVLYFLKIEMFIFTNTAIYLDVEKWTIFLNKCLGVWISKSYWSPRWVLGHIYNMKNQFSAGLGSRAVLVKKKFVANYEQLLRPVFLCFHRQKNDLIFFWKYCSVRTVKLHRIKVKKWKKNWEVFLRGEKPVF